jgi:hypothetical protein
MLRIIKAEQKFMRNLTKSSEASRATHMARCFEIEKAVQNAANPALLAWSRNRTLNMQDFGFLFRHRDRLSSRMCTYLEIICAKINHINDDNKKGYWNKLERNVGWTGHILPIAFSGCEFADNLVRCGLWSHAKNSRRCHKTDLCPLCLWNDILKVLVWAYGVRSGAFAKAPAWWFITCGFTTNSENVKCNSKDFERDDLSYEPRDRGYDPYPVTLGYGRGEAVYADEGYDDARIMGLIIQDAMDQLYKSKIVDGYRNKLEGAFGVFPGRPNRVNLHGHAVANGSETNGKFVAETLFEAMGNGIEKYRG